MIRPLKFWAKLPGCHCGTIVIASLWLMTACDSISIGGVRIPTSRELTGYYEKPVLFVRTLPAPPIWREFLVVKLASIDNDADWVLDRDFLANTVLPGLDATEVEVAFDPALVAVNRNRRDVGTYKKTLRFCIMVKQQPGRHLMAMVKENNIPLKKLGKDGPWILDPNKRVTLLKQLKEFYASRYKVPAPPSSRLEIIFPY